MQKIWFIACCMLLASCANQGGVHHNSGNAFKKASFKQAEQDFRQGRLMEARRHLQALNEQHPDYQRAQEMLKKTIEPARHRLLRYHQAKARKAEAKQQWFAAWQAWDEAALLSEDAQDRQRAEAILMRLRSARFAQLAKQRKQEDQQLLANLKDYQPSTSFDANDRAFRLLREDMDYWLDVRVQHSLQLAQSIRQKNPEIALILLESAQRLQEDSVNDETLDVLRKSLPKALLSAGKTASGKSRRHSAKKVKKPSISLAAIEAMVKKGDWQQAIQQRGRLHQLGQQGAALWQRIQQGAAKTAATWYAKGRSAFAAERVDDAVRFWKQAVSLAPGNEEYLDALMRASKVQERLQLIRGQQGE